MRRPRTATKSSPLSLQLEKARAQQQRPNAAKIIIIKNLKNKIPMPPIVLKSQIPYSGLDLLYGLAPACFS